MCKIVKFEQNAPWMDEIRGINLKLLGLLKSTIVLRANLPG